MQCELFKDTAIYHLCFTFTSTKLCLYREFIVLSSINILLVQSYHRDEATEDATVLLLPPPAWLVEAPRGPHQRASMGVRAMHAKERSVASPSLKPAERAATVLAGVRHRALYNALPRLELDHLYWLVLCQLDISWGHLGRDSLLSKCPRQTDLWASL